MPMAHTHCTHSRSSTRTASSSTSPAGSSSRGRGMLVRRSSSARPPSPRSRMPGGSPARPWVPGTRRSWLLRAWGRACRCCGGWQSNQAHDLEGELNVEAVFLAVQTQAAQRLDALEPVAHGLVVHEQPIGGAMEVAVAGEVALERMHQVALVRPVVIEQAAQRLLDESLEVRALGRCEQELEDPERLEDHHWLLWQRRRREREPCLPETLLEAED